MVEHFMSGFAFGMGIAAGVLGVLYVLPKSEVRKWRKGKDGSQCQISLDRAMFRSRN